MVQQRMERFRQKWMMLDELTHLEWEDAATNIRERDKKYGTSKLMVPAVVQLQTNEAAPAPPLTTFGELMDSHDIVPGISQTPQGTFQPGSSHITLGLVKPQSNSSILCGASAKHISVRAEWLRQSGCAPSEPSETPRW